VVVRFAAEVVEVFARAFATDFFFFFVVEVVEVWGEPAHAPMARAADKATVSGTRMSRKSSV
jgi:hypothetical protein